MTHAENGVTMKTAKYQQWPSGNKPMKKAAA